MPEISRFYGIVIKMFFRDQPVALSCRVSRTRSGVRHQHVGSSVGIVAEESKTVDNRMGN